MSCILMQATKYTYHFNLLYNPSMKSTKYIYSHNKGKHTSPSMNMYQEQVKVQHYVPSGKVF